MNLRGFLTSVFKGFAFNGELEAVKEAARHDAQIVVGTYLSEFEAEAARLFEERSQRLLGLDTIDAVSTPAVDTGRGFRASVARLPKTATKKGASK